MEKRIQIAVLDDYQEIALTMSNWSAIQEKADVIVFHDHVKTEPEVIDRLQPFDVVCVMRERTPLPKSTLSALPNLKLIVSTGKRNASIDIEACKELGIEIRQTGYVESGAIELTWALLMALAKKIVPENAGLKLGKWQLGLGTDLKGKTIGIVGLGNIGQKIALFAKAFDMEVIAWSPNLTVEKANESGAQMVTKEELFKTADFVTIHLVLSERSKGIINSDCLNLMKPTAYLINTSRGPLINEAALINTLVNKRIAGAALDVFDEEPLPPDHIFRKLDNILATPHIGYVTENTYKVFYEDTVNAITSWLNS